jgi:hypothetical protein
MGQETKKKQIKDLAGNTYEGVVVGIEEAVEPFGELRLADGAILKTKSTAFEVVRVDGKKDMQGNPLYIVNSGNTFIVTKPPDSSNG